MRPPKTLNSWLNKAHCLIYDFSLTKSEKKDRQNNLCAHAVKVYPQ